MRNIFLEPHSFKVKNKFRHALLIALFLNFLENLWHILVMFLLTLNCFFHIVKSGVPVN